MESNNKVKIFLKRFWYILWKDDSLKGWVFSIIFIFITIKFIFFPLLSLITGTDLPLVIVESCSMYHKGNIFSNFDSWWERHEKKYAEFQITKEEYKKFVLKRGLNKGDILFVIRANPKKLKKGDIIIFNANQRNPIIHRIVEIVEKDNKKIFSTIGDNNNGQLSFEKEINEEIILGKAVFRVAPYLGWLKLVFFDWQKPESERGLCKEN